MRGDIVGADADDLHPALLVVPAGICKVLPQMQDERAVVADKHYQHGVAFEIREAHGASAGGGKAEAGSRGPQLDHG